MSFAGTVYNVARAWTGKVVEVFTDDGALFVAADHSLVRRHEIAMTSPRKQPPFGIGADRPAGQV